MADTNDNANKPTDHNTGTGDGAHQALDDLTVLQNVDSQTLGDARLNVARPVDVSDTSLGNLANVQQGSTSNPQVQDVGGIVGGVNVALDVAIETSQSSSSAPPVLESTPVETEEEAATIAIRADGVKPLNVRAFDDLARPDAEFQAQEVTAGDGLGGGPVGGVVTGAAPDAVAPLEEAPAPEEEEIEQVAEVEEEVNTAPTVDAEGAGSGHGVIGGRVVASDADGDALSFSLSGADEDGLLHLDNGTVSIDASGNYVFTPVSGWHGGDTATFQVVVSDGQGGSAVQTVTVTETNEGPVVQTADESGHGTIGGRIGASDLDGDALSFSLSGVGEDGLLHLDNGTVSLDSSGNYVFTPVDGWQGGDTASFDVMVSDGHGGSVTRTVTVTETNEGPVINTAESTEVEQVGTVTGRIEAGDADSDLVTYHLVDSDGNAVDSLTTDNGTITIDSATGEYTFVASETTRALGADASITDQFQVQVSDGHGGSEVQSFSVTVDGLNDGPTTSDVNLGNVDEDNSVTISKADLLANASDIDGDTLSAASISASHGTVVDNGDGTITFTPDANYNGAVDFSYTVSDGQGGTVSGTASLDVAAVADEAAIVAPDVTVNYGGANTNESLAGTSGADTLVGGGGSDTLTGGAGNDVLYGDGGTAGGPFTIPLNIDASATVNSESVGSITISGLPGGAVLSAGTDNGDGSWTLSAADLDGLTATVDVASPFSVSVAVETIDGTDTEVTTSSLDVNFNNTQRDGNDTFRVVGNDGSTDTYIGGGGTDTIKGADSWSNDVIRVDNNLANLDSVEAIDGGSASDTILAGSGDDTLNFSNMSITNVEEINAGAGNDTITGTTGADTIFGGTGTDVMNGGAGNDTFRVVGNDGSTDTYRGGDGTDTIKGADSWSNDVIRVDNNLANLASIEAIDGGSASDTILAGSGDDTLDFSAMSITNVEEINAGAGNDTITGTSGADVIQAGSGNDTVNASQGSVGSDVYHGGAGTDTLQVSLSTEQYTTEVRAELMEFEAFAANPANAGQSFTFDTLGGLKVDNFEALKVSVDGEEISLSNPPEITTESISTAEDTTITGSIAATDVDGDTLTFALAENGGPEHGQLTLNSDGSYAYVPNDNWNGDDSFTVTVDDGFGNLVTQTITVHVDAVNDGPTTRDVDLGTVAEDNSVTISKADLLANASDIDGGTLSAASISASHGTVVDNGDGTITFTPDANYNGAVDFSYTVSDGQGGTVSGTASLDVNSVNDGPTTSEVELAGGAEDHTITINASDLLDNAADIDGGTLSVSNVTASNGTIVDNGDGTFSFTPNENFSGSVDVSYTISDGQGGTTQGSASLDVSAVADQASVSVSIGEGTVDPGGSFTVTNHDGSAGYHNTYGYYVMDDSGTPVSGEIIWKDVHDTNGQSVTIEGVDPDQVGFFIIPNGDQNGSIRDGSDVSFAKDASGNWQVLNGAGQVLSGTGTKVLFDNPALNSDRLDHVEDTSRDGGNQNWEDLNGGGDRDYNDLNMTVSWNEAEPTSSHEITVSANFPDMDGSEGHTVSISGLPAGATLFQDGVALVPGADGSYSLDPANLDGLTVTTPPGFTGDLNVDVSAVSVDGQSVASASASAEVTLDLGNDGPDAGAAESVTTAPGAAVTGQVEATDADGNTLNFSLATGNDGPQHGSVVLMPDGSFTYTPAAGFTGADTFKVVIDDGHGGTTTETVSVNVEVPNHGPVAGDDRTIDMVAQGPALSVDIGAAVVTEGESGSPSAWDGIAAMGDPTTATTTTNYGTDLNANYSGTSNADLVGIGRDSNASISTGNGDDQVTIGRDVNGNIDLGNGTNALDVADDVNASVSAGSGNDTVRVTDDLNGKIDLGNGDNRLEIGGDANNSVTAGSGNDQVKIGGGVNSKVELGSGNDDLHIGGDANASIVAGQGDDRVLVGDDVSAKIDLGSGDDYLKVTDDTWASIDAGQGNDTVSLGGDISAKVDMGTGDDHLTITGQNLWATVTGGQGNDSIELTGVSKAQWDANTNGIKGYVKDFENIKFSDGQVIGDASAFQSGEATPDTYEYPLTVTAAVNDTDGSESLSVVTIDNLPAGATLMAGDTVLAANNDGTYSVQVTSGQSVELTVVSNEPLDLSGLTTSVTATEEKGGDTATTTVTGEGSDAGQTTADESIATAEDRSLTLNASDLLANDSDADGDALSISGVGNASHGTVSMDENGAIVFTPDPDFHGTATFDYTVSDGKGGTDTATVTLRVDSVNDAPVIEDVSGGAGFENTVITGDIDASDVDGDQLGFTLGTGNGAPQHGTVELQPDGSFTYTPAANYVGEDSFTVVVSDGRGGTTSETITVTVAEANAAPVINAALTTATVSIDYDSPNSSNIGRVVATDADGDNLTYTVLDGDQHGSLYLDSDSGSFFYNSDDTSWSGTDVFSVQVDDGQGGLTTQTITVNVAGGSGGGSQSAGHVIGWGNGGGRDESWGENGSWTVGGSGGGHANNGYGNGDQDAPGNSGDHNNAENGSGGGRGHGGSSGGHGHGGNSGGGHGHGGSNGSGGGRGHGGSNGDVVQASDDGTNWGSGWRAYDSGNPGQAGTGDSFSITGDNRHNEVYNGESGDTLIGAGGNDYMSLDNGYGKQMIEGFDHIQLGDGAHATLDMTTPTMDYGNLTVAGGTGHDVIWSAGGDDLLVAGDGGNSIHGGAGDDTIVAGAGADNLMGQNGDDMFLFDFGTGHDVVNGGSGANWTDTIDLSTNMGEGASITITSGDNSWTVQSDGDHHAAGNIQLGQDKSGTITVHSDQGDQTIEFTNIESIKF